MDEALYSATYVDNYIDSVENLPDDVQRHLSRIRDIDVQYRNLLRDVDHYYDLWRSLQNCAETNSGRRARSVTRMQQSLIQAQELGDEKMQIVTQLQELIDHKTRQLDTDQKNLDIKEDKEEIMQIDESGATSQQKQTRAQSPSRAADSSGCGAGNSNGYGVANSAVNSTSAGGGNSTPNSERSGNSNTLSAGNNSNGNGGNLTQVVSVENQRAISKRSRRRNDTVCNMELGGNESNSANEGGGSNGGERNPTQKSTTAAGTQKKNAAQNQAGTSAGSSNLAGSGSGSGNGGATGTVAASGSGAGNTTTGKKKKRKARGGATATPQTNAREDTPPLDPIDPDEPTYCVCNQISFGEMILCDNDLCPIEWFHFSCVSLVLKPKGKWYCPNCRGDRPNVMKPKAQFLKELERYNKEKEEKT
ncbi:inhibitor of growth protein 1 [Calliphora vicina]|uniref:inhibitor of growth protein 1 n=1 Tax=Calliphora vicina TaxID=7373 RepID=UPI00325BABFF